MYAYMSDVDMDLDVGFSLILDVLHVVVHTYSSLQCIWVTVTTCIMNERNHNINH